MSTESQAKTDWDNLTDGLWQMYERLGNADQAELRRGLPSEPFWRMLSYIGRDDPHEDDLPKWRILIQCVAIAGYSSTSFGVALKEAGYSKARLKRLLEADDEQLPTLLRRTAKQLRSAGQSANWNAARKLLFYDGDNAEKARLRIAQQYYTYTTHSNQDDSADE